MDVFRCCGIPARTLNRRWKSGDLTEKKLSPPCMQISSLILGLRKAFAATSRFMTSCNILFVVVLGLFGVERDSKIVARIKELGEAEFAPVRRTLHSIAYRFSVDLNLTHKFNSKEEISGHGWLRSFTDRNWDLSVRQSGLSFARGQEMNHTVVNNYLKIF
jgi:hypothetical protein